ncbi:MAG: T9SS type A sorting domain-containing protein [Burkholderiales bacterium]|nr:T9SS type A sorting domain-containing protein [Bacteroidia bacterium]
MFSFYPNPAKDFLNIEYGKNIENVQAKIYNLSGELVLNEN